MHSLSSGALDQLCQDLQIFHDVISHTEQHCCLYSTYVIIEIISSLIFKCTDIQLK